MKNHVTEELANRYVRNTYKDAIVQEVQALLCEITIATMKGIGCTGRKTYINTRVLKHIYDKRPAEEFDFLLANISKIVKFPDTVFKNKNPKRGDYIFLKALKNNKYLCSVEEISDKKDDCHFEVATFFRLRKESYLASYNLLWEWKGGKPSS